MANIPFRGLASKGILRDPDPFSLDMSSWSAGYNVMFRGAKVERSPGFRTVYDAFPATPQACIGRQPSIGYASVLVMATDGRSWNFASNAVTETTPTVYTPSAATPAWTMDILGDVVYANRPDQVPLQLSPSATEMDVLPGWDSSWRAKSLRAFGNYMVAMNVTKGSTQIQNLVKWSDLALQGSPPASWDETDPTTNAGETPLEQSHTPLVDGLPLRGSFAIYSNNEVWLMEPVANNDVFHFRRAFGSGGMINPNCAVEVDGVHYVFGPNDVYKHDGVSKESIIEGRNHEALFKAINSANLNCCFVHYDPRRRNVLFAFNGNDPDCAFPSGDFCNMGALYSIPNDAWTLFVDLPNMSGMTRGNVNTALTYSGAGSTYTYDSIGGTYFSQEANFDDQSIGVGAALSGSLTEDRIYGWDFLSKGTMAYPICEEATPPPWIERLGIDLDEMGADLRSYKIIRAILPQTTIFDGETLDVRVGGHLYPGSPVTYSDAVTFDPRSGYKCDIIGGGRYLAVRFDFDAFSDFELASYDLDLTPNGQY